jgi:hypothetical protein
MKKYFFTEKGLTLIEILASITILFIIIMSMLTMFAQTARTNNTSKNITDATYVAESCMEDVNNSLTISNISWSNLTSPSSLSLPSADYQKVSNNLFTKINETNGHYVLVEFLQKENPLVSIKVKVYNENSSSKKLETQMEKLITLK